MTLTDLVGPAQVLFLDRPAEKPQLLRDLGRRAAELAALDASQVVEALLRREALGSTGLGGGLALPHARFAGLPRALGLLALLHPAVAYDAIDSAPVDIVFLLLMPDGGEALKVLAAVSRSLRRPDILSRLRATSSPAAALDVLRQAPNPG
jgi:PTS system nitrogen regulatory IIA component